MARDIEFSNLRLTMLDGQLANVLEIRPSLFNSATFGTIFTLASMGSKIEDAVGISDNPVKSIVVKSGNSHRGTLLFHLPEEFAMIQSIKYNSSSGNIRLSKNVYIDITEDNMSISHIKIQLVTTIIPTTGHMILLDIYTSIRKFTELNGPLRAAW